MESQSAILTERLRYQAKACDRVGSPLYAGLLGRAAEDVEARGPTWEVLRGHELDPGPSALALRFMGAVNRLVLAGGEPELAAIYADAGWDEKAAWRAFADLLERNTESLRDLVDLPVQTNEVGRCAALLPGFLSVAAETGLPLRLLEVGASAGLNLRWDRYRYLAGDFAWGPMGSPVRIEFELRGEVRFPTPPAVEIAERSGCDPAPIDPTLPEGRLSVRPQVGQPPTRRLPGCGWSPPVSSPRSGSRPGPAARTACLPVPGITAPRWSCRADRSRPSRRSVQLQLRGDDADQRSDHPPPT